MTIIEAVTPKAKRAGRGINPPEVYAYFVEQCRANLHMVLAMSPVGDAFRSVLAHLACLIASLSSLSSTNTEYGDAFGSVLVQFAGVVSTTCLSCLQLCVVQRILPCFYMHV